MGGGGEHTKEVDEGAGVCLLDPVPVRVRIGIPADVVDGVGRHCGRGRREGRNDANLGVGALGLAVSGVHIVAAARGSEGNRRPGKCALGVVQHERPLPLISSEVLLLRVDEVVRVCVCAFD